MTTNPSTGLPEELEKIKLALDQKLFPMYCQHFNGAYCEACAPEKIEKAFRDVLDWACKRLCVMCKDGDSAFLADNGQWCHLEEVDEDEHLTVACAASVLREGKS